MSLLKKILPNPFFLLLKKAKIRRQSRFLVLWNRGLGDIPLGLFALVQKIKTKIPHAEISFITREDLYDAFAMLDGVFVHAHPSLKRGDKPSLEELMRDLKLSPSNYDCFIEKIDTDRWLSWQLGRVTPKLIWKKNFDHLSLKFSLKGKDYIGIHVSSETGQFYGYNKNWPKENFQKLFEKILKGNERKILLFGFKQDDDFNHQNIVDLRGKTTIFEMLSIMKNHCSHFVAPDSGILSLSYYLDERFPLKMISLWADPKQGILKQNVASPNPLYEHKPLIAPEKKIENISVEVVYRELTSCPY